MLHFFQSAMLKKFVFNLAEAQHSQSRKQDLHQSYLFHFDQYLGAIHEKIIQATK